MVIHLYQKRFPQTVSSSLPVSSNHCSLWPNRSAVRECKDLDMHLKNFNNKGLLTVTGTTNDFCLLGSADLHMCCSQTDQNIAGILFFLNNLLMFYQAFGLNLSFNHECGMFVAGGACASIILLRSYQDICGKHNLLRTKKSRVRIKVPLRGSTPLHRWPGWNS